MLAFHRPTMRHSSWYRRPYVQWSPRRPGMSKATRRAWAHIGLDDDEPPPVARVTAVLRSLLPVNSSPTQAMPGGRWFRNPAGQSTGNPVLVTNA